jgi:hypothetical protein
MWKDPRMGRRRIVAASVAALGCGALGVAAAADGPEDPVGQAKHAQLPAPTAPAPELPRGGRSILPEFRVYAHYGAPQATQLGILGIGSAATAGARLNRRARDYAGKGRRPVLPAMELIGVIANATPGEGGKYRTRQTDKVIRTYLAAARKAKALLILDIQPGRSDFLTEAKAFEKFLIEPDVGLALDPEWRMGPGQLPGKVIGSVDASELNDVTQWLSDLVNAGNLPDKLVIVHQFTDGMIRRKKGLKERFGVDMVLNADGFGSAAAKAGTYGRVVRDRGPFHTGFKLFYVEDSGLMSPRQVYALRPRPEVVIYE